MQIFQKTFVQVDDVKLVEEVTGCLVDLVADEVYPALLLTLGKGGFDAAHYLVLSGPLLSQTTASRSPR